jgi:flagellar hook-length control protein FliK
MVATVPAAVVGAAPSSATGLSPLPSPAAVAPPTPGQQVVTVLAPLRSTEDGSHEVTIGLEPEGLGTVKATVTVSAGQVVVQLGTDNDQARDALRQALPLLRHELGGDGASANVLLANDGHSAPDGFARPSSSASGPTADDEPDDADPTTTATPDPVSGRPGHIDLHL